MDTERILGPLAGNDHDHDGRPPVGYRGDDPLLERLCRFHPELIPAELIKQLATNRARVTF